MTQISDDIFLNATMIASAISGLFAKLFSHPVDTVKAKAQIDVEKLEVSDLMKKRSIAQIVKNTLKNEGLKGFYPGIGIATIGSVPATILYFTSYEISKSNLASYEFFKKNEALNFFCSGMLAESFSCLLWVPIDIIKERLQVQKNLKLYSYKNSFDALKQIVLNEGFFGLYRAYGATLASFGPFSAFFFLFYEKLKKVVCENPKSPGVFETLILSASSSSVASCLTSPLDMAKLRMQIQRGERAASGEKGRALEKGKFGYKNMFHGIQLIYSKEGILALYKGVVPRITVQVINAVTNFTLMEWSRNKVLKNLYKIDLH